MKQTVPTIAERPTPSNYLVRPGQKGRKLL
jgi:hypothetical protein